MQYRNNHRARWLRAEAAKHTTPESIRQRIAEAEKEIRDLTNAEGYVVTTADEFAVRSGAQL